MEWIKAILAKFTNEDGTVDIEAVNKEIDAEFPKNAIPKEQYNNVSTSLKEAQKTITSLEAQTKDNPDIQKELETYKTKTSSLEQENKQLKIDSQVDTALRSLGSKDIEYAKFKLGHLELDKEGNVKDLDSRLKDLKTTLPDYFEAIDTKPNEEENHDPLDGFNRIDAKPGEGNRSESNQTQAMIDAFTADLPAAPQ